MSFLYPVLFGGLVLAGVPVLLHLIMKQKPKHLLFPALRFLLQRQRTNQRKLRLRHLLLLALRLFLIAGMCLALARPKIFSERINLGERPIAAVLLFDTSLSMEYKSGGQTRLEAAQRRALELLDELPEGSRIALLDTAEAGRQWLPTISLAREQIAERKLRPANYPVTTPLADAYRLFADLDQETEGTDEAALPKFLYILSDRGQNSWDPGRLKDLLPLRDGLKDAVNTVYVDVGVDSPVDIALTTLELERQIIPVYDRMILKVTVQATGADCDTEAICRLDGEQAAERKPVRLAAGQSQVLTFERGKLALGPHSAEVTLATADSLPFNNALFATFEVRGGRRVLLLVDERQDADIMELALKSTKDFQCDVRTLTDLRQLFPQDLNQYQAICLLNVVKPDRDAWEKLAAFVKQGGGLAVVPGEDDPDTRKSYNETEAAQRLLPGRLIKVVQAKVAPAKTEAGVGWKEAGYNHPVMAAIREWSMREDVDFAQLHPAASRYWEIEPHKGSDAHMVVHYDDAEGRPALLERLFDKKTGMRGRVLLFTTPLDRRHLAGSAPWNDYLKSWFYLALVKLTIGYLAGDAEEANYNFLSGQQPRVRLQASPRTQTYTLKGPGLSATETVVTQAVGQDELTLPQAVTPGNYSLVNADGKGVAFFSVNAVPDESQIDRKFSVPVEQIEQLLGAGAVLPLGHGKNLREALQGHWSQPLELFPWLMILILLAIALENLLANKFYRRESMENEESSTKPSAPTTD